MNVQIPGWQKFISSQAKQPYHKELLKFLEQEYSSGRKIHPIKENVYRALNLTSVETVKVVIIGQDPYHGSQDGQPQAQGLCFSVPAEIKNPPSLQNIFKEQESELGHKPLAQTKSEGDLTLWAKQGVLLLNSVLTVEAGKPASHAKQGWEHFTDNLIDYLSKEYKNLVFLLWGTHARSKKALINSDRHLILESSHPSPLSAYRGFFGNDHFLNTNSYLIKHGKKPIGW